MSEDFAESAAICCCSTQITQMETLIKDRAKEARVGIEATRDWQDLLPPWG